MSGRKPTQKRSAFARKRLLVQYRQATRNEIAIDEQAARYAGTSPATIGHIPRPGLWMGKAGLDSRVSRPLSAILATAWRLTRGLPLHVLKAATLAMHARHVGGFTEPTVRDRVGLALSRRAMEVISVSAVPDAPVVWIVPPWVDAEGLGKDRTLVDATALLTPSDFLDALGLALAATSAMAKDLRQSRWILQSYTAVPWFCLRIALSRVEGRLFMAEHFDRWAVLADQRAVEARRQARGGPAKPKTTLALMQHGEVASLSGDEEECAVLPYRLDAVSELLVYDGAAEHIFRTRILTARCASGVVVRYFQPSIALFETPDDGAVRILFVGHPICAQLHVAIHGALAGHSPIQAYYKPHPAAGSADISREQSWNMLNNQSGFPRVDMLVAYPSTLVREYAMHGIGAFVHPLNVDKDGHSAIVGDAVEYLEEVLEQKNRAKHRS